MTIEQIKTEVQALVWEEIGGEQPINPSDRLDNLGLDSLSFMELMLSVQNHFAVEISDLEIATIDTVADLECLLTAKLA